MQEISSSIGHFILHLFYRYLYLFLRQFSFQNILSVLPNPGRPRSAQMHVDTPEVYVGMFWHVLHLSVKAFLGEQQ
jgi:hypothetical protein